MKKVTLFMFFCFLTTLLVAQTRPDGTYFPNGTGRDTEPITVYLHRDDPPPGEIANSPGHVASPYEVVRIGEYYWTNRNLSEQKTTQWHRYNLYWDWWPHEVPEGDMPTQTQLNNYMNFVRLPNDKFVMNQTLPLNDFNNDFNKYYGIFYHLHAIEGNVSGNSRFIRHMGAAFKMQEAEDNSSKAFTGWDVPNRAAFQQLLGMCTPAATPLRLSAIDARVQLGPIERDRLKNDPKLKTKPWLTNPLAYDIAATVPGSGYKTYWFEITNNKLGFNLMPGGGRSDGNWTYKLDGFGSKAMVHGDFYQLFYVAKFGYYQGSLDIHDLITFYPIRKGEQANSAGTWYNTRYAKRLDQKELLYDVVYVPRKQDPKLAAYDLPGYDLPDYDLPELHYRKKDKGKDARLTGVEKILPDGYLRGFFVQHKEYEIEKDTLYDREDFVKMVRCVEDETMQWRLAEEEGFITSTRKEKGS